MAQDEELYFDNLDEDEPEWVDRCPHCGYELDDIDNEFQLCSHCGESIANE